MKIGAHQNSWDVVRMLQADVLHLGREVRDPVSLLRKNNDV